ncbi:hypothetical protein EV561_14921 [Rhizobium sp. BK376]|nr:hypothetical protein EV561_14921 [Rhizobium sp. BK376]
MTWVALRTRSVGGKILREPMPFYLVTQTSLIEANDERDAARKGIDQIRSAVQVNVAVKSDETTVTHIVVTTMIDEPRPVPPVAPEAVDA